MDNQMGYNDQGTKDAPIPPQPMYEAPQPPYQAPQPPYQPPYQQPPQYMPPYQQPTGGNGRGMSIASLVLGIVSLCICCVWYIAVPAAIVGLVLGIISLVKKYDGHGMALAGVICSGAGLLLLVLFWIFVVLLGMTSLTAYPYNYY